MQREKQVNWKRINWTPFQGGKRRDERRVTLRVNPG